MDGAPQTSLKKQEIINEAYRVFQERGFQATGVDALLADTGISKRTLYKYFDSKESLIEAVLEQYLASINEGLFQRVDNDGGDARARIRQLFRLRRECVAAGDYQGCLAIKAQQEFVGRSAGIESVTLRTSQMLEAGFAKLTREAGLSDPEGKARALLLLFQGATVASQMRRNPGAFDDAMIAVDLLLA